LFLMASDKIHPLWYSEFIPVLFFISSIFAGLSMVIFEGSISSKVFSDQISHEDHKSHNGIILGLAKVCAVAMFVYLFAKLIVLIHGQQWELLSTKWGSWYLVEVIGFVLIPLLLFVYSVRNSNVFTVKVASLLTMIGIILNRLNISVIAFKWDMPNHYVPTWMEIEVTLCIIFIEIWVIRWVVNRMPVLRQHPKY
jgi:Ni/Fe-hydrogenase subunit HybB-like protein